MVEKYKQLKNKAKGDVSFVNFLTCLYEKHLISSQTLLEIVGFDSKEETERLKNDVVSFSSSKPGTSKKESALSIQLARIEQARRNVEALTRLLEHSNYESAVSGTLEANIAIMGEVDKIK